MLRNQAAFNGSPELRGSYELCAAETRQFLAPMWTATELVPTAIRPHFHAVHAFMARTDRLADEGAQADREKRTTRWRRDTLEELRSGHSEHPLRRAFVDTVWQWDLDRGMVEEFLDAIWADCVRPPMFETFADQRRYLRGASGAVAELWTPLLGARGPEVSSLFSVLGEVCQLVDIFEDLPVDLAAGRCYLPREDMRGLGLEVDDLQRGVRREALEELVGVQLGRWRGLLEQAVPVTATVGPEYQPFLYGLLLGAQLQFDEVTLQQARVFVDGVEPLTAAGAARRRPARPDVAAVPGHVAVIMDGNRRWAALRGLPTAQGHHAGERAAMRLVNAALRLGVRHLSIYAFSTENWDRSQEELAALFDTLADGIAQGATWLHELGVQVRWCGRRDRIEPSLASALALVESLTSNNDVLSLTLCVDYGGRDELAAAARALAAEAVAGTIRPEDIGPADLARNLYVPGLPDVDLLIRTSGEQRISNFLPWHLAYAELVFDPTPWPDFGLAQLQEAVTAYAGRRRRFGGDLPAPARPVRSAPIS
ncbi:polyprenyl diphosphate synthase [Kitasatospora sp. GAS204B]|uniref:polyprenyl diphosphate synthase n=1 Tax=unclassified Kitasatospora TaxID=2633591 RepID=UPI00247692D8|nr:polyprenyl diphosphate synthase [Kitasatospora sp. GAS204B]MDH6122553.1 undecaprenyl diphosphate synthase [Kitasatospora sp. GAS204B]